MAVAERLLNFAHTGSARVLPNALLTALFPLRAISEGYMPMFSDDLILGGDTNLGPHFSLARWPRNQITGKPYLASMRVQELTYGSDHFLVRPLFAEHLPASAPRPMF